MVVASDLFFFNQDTATSQMTSPTVMTSSFRKHIRCRTLFAEADNPQAATGPGNSSPICAFISRQQVSGNSAAEALIERRLPCTLDELPLTPTVRLRWTDLCPYPQGRFRGRRCCHCRSSITRTCDHALHERDNTLFMQTPTHRRN